MKRIESKNNDYYKGLMKLKTRKGRMKAGQYLIDGHRIVMHALQHHKDVCAVIVTDTYLSKYPTPAFTNVIVVTESMFKQLIETDTPQGILAVVRITEQSLRPGKWLYLDGIQDPGNMGTLIRTADAAGFGGVILAKGCTDPFSQKALRSSMGSIMSIPVKMQQDVNFLKQCKRPLYGAALEGGISYREMEYASDSVLIIGNEGNGISKEVLKLCQHRVYIPMIGDVESLNASIAGGILMFDMQKTCTE